MRIFKLLTFILLAIMLNIFFHNAFAFDDGDFQYWNTESVSWQVKDNWKIKLEEEFRFGDNAGDFYYQHSDFGLTYSGLADWFNAGINYRLLFEEKNSVWKQENRPHLNATIKWKWLDMGFSNRARFEYRDKEDSKDTWRYRNKFAIKMPWKVTEFEIQPYIADEIFYDFDADKLNRNRLYSGIGFKISKNLNADIFYLWESTEKSDKWNDYHILGVKLKVHF